MKLVYTDSTSETIQKKNALWGQSGPAVAPKQAYQMGDVEHPTLKVA